VKQSHKFAIQLFSINDYDSQSMIMNR